ncbi:hypothetical protein K458DRAFT_366875 [Lentithecium fluviatile CBS 122367]|uniref:Diaminohydroxyphosphoribosylamino-pyrimidine deaminase n=1 Tax=Lentithecium fluviatile CBS 122367 TaxID=1168545 RepID=A0A6G1J2P1_9PLEO|nr:hypothetical protein K458DRAFT_366875 [Lentithecium fluviatile CBS 122367]
MDGLLSLLGDPVTDPEEEAFVVFSQSIPSQSLGFIDSQAAQIELNVGGRDLTIRQSRGLLTSDRKSGTTVVWRVTPPFAEWVASPNVLSQAGYVSPDSVAIELGAGVSGIVALTLGPKIKRYIATDQDYAIRLLKQNLVDNLPAPENVHKKHSSKTKASKTAIEQHASSIETLELDWELDSVSSLPALLGQNGSGNDGQGVDLVIACDCIYNEALIEPLNSTCTQICRIRSSQQPRPTLCLVAQQLRSPDVFETWLKSFHRSFHVWRVPDKDLTEGLRENSGFIVHVGLVR